MSSNSIQYDNSTEQSTDPKTADSDARSCTYWVREDGREFITDPEGDVVNLARLTAYAEHGEAIHDAQAHHRIPALKIDAPAFLGALTQEEHGRLHGSNPEPVVVNGIPLLRS